MHPGFWCNFSFSPFVFFPPPPRTLSSPPPRDVANRALFSLLHATLVIEMSLFNFNSFSFAVHPPLASYFFPLFFQLY